VALKGPGRWARVVWFLRRKPEPARANTSTPEGVLDKAGKVWLVTFFGRNDVGPAKRVVTTNLKAVFGDGWNYVGGNTYFRQTERGLEILHIYDDGEVWRWFFGTNGDVIHRTIAKINQVEVVG